MHTIRFRLLLLVLFCPPSMVGAQTVWYVDAGASGKNKGTSWKNAYNELQSALAVARTGDEVWVASGGYLPDYDVMRRRHTGDRDAAFHVADGVGLYGGFAGGEKRRKQRDWETNETVLDGDLLGDDEPEFVNYEENSLAVVRFGEATAGVLDGFTVRGSSEGAAVRVSDDATPTIANCILRHNSGIAGGGAMYADYESRPNVVDCRFEGNRAYFGAGIDSFVAKPMLKGCTFVDNAASIEGGALSVAWGGGARIDRCTFSGNTARTGGAIYEDRHGHRVRMTDCVFEGNHAGVTGGAIYAGIRAEPDVRDSLFVGNTAHYGGAIANVDRGNARIVDCVFRDNEAFQSGGAWFNGRHARMRIYNGLFHDNVAGRGGAGYETGRAWVTEVVNCTIVDNEAHDRGGGLFPNGTMNVLNTILCRNRDARGVHEFAQLGRRRVRNLGYTCLEDCHKICKKNGYATNMRDDPMFADAEQRDYRLTFPSWVIDAGDATIVPPDVPLDLDGRARKVDDPYIEDTGKGAPAVDLGAYELQTPLCDPILKLKTHCKDGSPRRIKATLRSTYAEGTRVIATLNGQKPRTRAADADGRIDFRWNFLDPGEYTVAVRGCDVRRAVDCP